MNKVIIHAAYPRTASTWFQESFYPNILNYNFINAKNFREFIQNKETKFNFKEINQNNNLIFCDEEIMNIKKNTLDIKSKAKKIKQNFPGATIIIFIRNQIKILESKYSFYVQNGGTKSFNKMIEHLFDTNKINQWNYFEQITLYTNLFGRNNVKIYFYEDFKANNKLFLKNYISTFNFDIDFNAINFNIKNYSLNNNIIKYLRFFNQFTREKNFFEPDEEKILINIPYLFYITRKIFFNLNKILSKNNIKLEKNITRKNYLRIINFFSESNQKLISEFNLTCLNKYKYPL